MKKLRDCQEISLASGEPYSFCAKADLLVEYLRQLGVEFVFGVPGGAIEPLVNALARAERRGGPKCVMARHETGAAFMAEGYYNATGKLGVCFATTGPGATNLVTGIASANANNIPILAITAQTPLSTFGKGAFQESSCTSTDILSIFGAITRYNSLISHAEQFEHKLAAAVMTALRAPSGPVHLTIPNDIFRAPAGPSPSYKNLKKLVLPSKLFDTCATEDFLEVLTTSKSPVFVIGHEAKGALALILELAAWINIPVIETPQGKGLVNPFHPLYRGVIGFAGHVSALQTLQSPEVDLVVAIGTPLGEWASNGWDGESIMNSRLVHVEHSSNHLMDSPMARLHLTGDLGGIFDFVLKKLALAQVPRSVGYESIQYALGVQHLHFSHDDEISCHSDNVPLLPQRLMTELPKLFPSSTTYLADTGNSFAWAVHYLHPQGPIDGVRGTAGLFKASIDFASMGWAIACAVGTAMGTPGSPVVAITGDGSYLMAGQEITVAVEYGLPIVYVVLNDSGYGMVKHGQRLVGAEQTGFALPFVNFAEMAASMGVPGFVISTVEELQNLDIESICASRGPTLLDVRIDPEAIPPIGLRTNLLRDK